MLATFSAKKTQICHPEVVIIGQKCTPAGRLPDDDKAAKVLNWPILTNTKDLWDYVALFEYGLKIIHS